MKLIEFGFRNVFSYGNKLQTFKIKPNEANLVLISGHKGQGKSSIKESLILSIYGKSPFRKLKKIPNRINRNSYLYNKYVTNAGQVIETERGLAPDFLRLKIDGTTDNKVSTADKTKLNQIIEDDLVKIPFTVFCNTVTISVNSFKSFVSLSPDDKRKIIDKIFGLEDINSMNELNKAEIKTHTEDVTRLNQIISHQTTSLESTTLRLEEIQKKIDKDLTNQIKDAEISIKAMNGTKEILQEEYRTNKAALVAVQTTLESERETLNKAKNSIAEIQKKLDLYAKGKCPHCLSNLTDHDHLDINSKLVKMKETFQSKLESMTSNIRVLTTDVNTRTENLHVDEVAFYNVETNIKLKKSELTALNKQLTSTNDTEQAKLIIEDLKSQIETATIERAAAKELLMVNLEVAQALSPEGMKSLLMAQIIPIINQQIIERSAEIEFPFSFEFNDQFEPMISQLGQEIELEELSTGEQKEMNLITLFCILDLILMKTNLNFLFLDEIYTSLDRESIYRVISMLRKFADKHKITIFTVSHDPLPDEFFDTKINITKDKYFSDIILS